jgi:hypothetical protein
VTAGPPRSPALRRRNTHPSPRHDLNAEERMRRNRMGIPPRDPRGGGVRGSRAADTCTRAQPGAAAAAQLTTRQLPAMSSMAPTPVLVRTGPHVGPPPVTSSNAVGRRRGPGVRERAAHPTRFPWTASGPSVVFAIGIPPRARTVRAGVAHVRRRHEPPPDPHPVGGPRASVLLLPQPQSPSASELVLAPSPAENFRFSLHGSHLSPPPSPALVQNPTSSRLSLSLHFLILDFSSQPKTGQERFLLPSRRGSAGGLPAPADFQLPAVRRRPRPRRRRGPWPWGDQPPAASRRPDLRASPWRVMGAAGS